MKKCSCRNGINSYRAISTRSLLHKKFLPVKKCDCKEKKENELS